jgi:hypothetical protein
MNAGLDEVVIRKRIAGYFALLETLEEQAVPEVPRILVGEWHDRTGHFS